MPTERRRLRKGARITALDNFRLEDARRWRLGTTDSNLRRAIPEEDGRDASGSY
jgi:hypothetical protein